MIDFMGQNTDGLFVILKALFEPVTKKLTATDITNKYIALPTSPKHPKMVWVFFDRYLGLNKAGNLGGVDPDFEMDGVDSKNLFFLNIDAENGVNSEHTGLEAKHVPLEGTEVTIFYVEEQETDVIKLDSKPQANWGYDDALNILGITTWLSIGGDIIRTTDDATVTVFDEDHTVHYTANDVTAVDGIFAFQTTVDLPADKTYTLEIQINYTPAGGSQTEFEFRYRMGAKKEFVIDITEDSKILDQLMDIRGLLGENTAQTYNYNENTGLVDSVDFTQHTDSTNTVVRKSWRREITERDGRKITQTYKIEVANP